MPDQDDYDNLYVETELFKQKKLMERKQMEATQRHGNVTDYLSIEEMKQLEEWTERHVDKILCGFQT